MELWCNFPFPPTLCRVIYLSAHQPNLICVVRNSRTALTLERKTKKKKEKKEQVLSIRSIIDFPYPTRVSFSVEFFKTLFTRHQTFFTPRDELEITRYPRDFQTIGWMESTKHRGNKRRDKREAKSWRNKSRVEKMKGEVGSGCVEKRVSISRRSGKIGSRERRGAGSLKADFPFPSIPIRRDACESAFSLFR